MFYYCKIVGNRWKNNNLNQEKITVFRKQEKCQNPSVTTTQKLNSLRSLVSNYCPINTKKNQNVYNICYPVVYSINVTRYIKFALYDGCFLNFWSIGKLKSVLQSLWWLELERSLAGTVQYHYTDRRWNYKKFVMRCPTTWQKVISCGSFLITRFKSD